ncbi:MAG: class I SAM-dependent methyltransferase [Runella slithyformis]|nr:MAG: class I SAM-dependent methyltransferase [Runella slithyformis]TAF93309.1 MAG: class I SAM-dependent methyltransferase [Runella sp.]TAG23978.1 MAG: class I SAM-dependent methyltransferase [Cytophagales bacterium]TAG34674.1 MAG: class I SAM-dependent methyltransferase [Cytophagia bacterium]TAF26158.1 MAG: class I SAM-dependent methyltransferase [Runella slithyformis]
MRIPAFFKYLFSAQNQHGLHSPFVFDLYRNVIEKDAQSVDFEAIGQIRNEMRRSSVQMQITDFGAGSRVNQSSVRAVRDVARNSEKPPRLGRLFYRLLQYFGSKTIFDLGTSLGITTLYLAAANASSKVWTFEGCPETARVAQQNFDKQPQLAQRIELVVGNIDQTLPQQVAIAPPLDFVFFDANHRYEPTVRYFETCLAKAHEGSLFVFDDIHWSAEMEAAWATIRQHEAVSVSIDLYWVGLVFFRKKQRKQHFTLRFPFW